MQTGASFAGALCTPISTKKRAEDALKRSEAFLAEGQRLSRIGIYPGRVETDEIIWSEELYRILMMNRVCPCVTS